MWSPCSDEGVDLYPVKWEQEINTEMATEEPKGE